MLVIHARIRLRELADPEARRVLAHLAGGRAYEEDFFSHGL